MKRRILLTLLPIFISFVAGFYIWKAYDTSRRVNPIELDKEQSRRLLQSEIVSVGNDPITREDLEFEYHLHTLGVFNESDLTPIPDLGGRYDDELDALRATLMRTIVERKILYLFVKMDKSFNAEDPKRLEACEKGLKEAIEAKLEVLKSEKNKNRLKTRLCEESIVKQYLEEKVFSAISVTEQEAVEYFKNNRNEFFHPQKVLISQIVLADEKQAKKVRNKIKKYNFAALAKQYSITPEAEQGGKLGPFSKQAMPRVFDVAFSMRPGQISDILKSTYGFHIIRLERKYKKRELSLEEAAPSIKKFLTHQKKEEEYRKWVELALNSINVKPPKAM